MKTNDIIEAFGKFTATGDKSNGILLVDNQGGDSFCIRTTNSAYHDLLSLLVNTMVNFLKRADNKHVALAVLADIYTSVGLENNEEDTQEFLNVLSELIVASMSTESPTIQ